MSEEIVTTNRAGHVDNMSRPVGTPRPARGRRHRDPGRSAWVPLVLLTPAGVVMLAVVGYPFVRLVVNSFQDFGIRALFEPGLHFIGLSNYSAVVSDPEFWPTVVRSVLFTAALVIVSVVIGTLIAQLMMKIGRVVRSILSAIMVAAWAVPTVAATVVWQWLFEPLYGVINWILTQFGIFGNLTSYNSFAHQTSGFIVVGILIVWQAVPFIALTVYAGQSQIPTDYYEAARLDGAGAFQIYRSVTFPFLRQVLALVTILSVIWDFTVFNQIWILTQGGPNNGTTTLGIWNYLLAFANNNYGEASALAILTVIFLMIVTAFYIRVLVRREKP